MGPDLDVILIGLIGDTRARTEARADALILLADRGSPLALPTLSSALQYDNERLRSAAVLGLNRLADPVADELIRRATYDRSRTVRLNALQSLDIQDVETIRQVLLRETDREVRLVGMQLIALAEARGAPLAPDFRGSLRTMSGENEPQIVFRPFVTDSTARVSRGDLRIELPELPDIALAAGAVSVANVVPAFFSPSRAHVVFESNGQIGVADIDDRTIRWVAAGIAPRPIPFTNKFVFLREREIPPAFEARGRRLVYDVNLASFEAAEYERIGELNASRLSACQPRYGPRHRQAGPHLPAPPCADRAARHRREAAGPFTPGRAASLPYHPLNFAWSRPPPLGRGTSVATWNR
jgi:hypothetical protein